MPRTIFRVPPKTPLSLVTAQRGDELRLVSGATTKPSVLRSGYVPLAMVVNHDMTRDIANGNPANRTDFSQGIFEDETFEDYEETRNTNAPRFLRYFIGVSEGNVIVPDDVTYGDSKYVALLRANKAKAKQCLLTALNAAPATFDPTAYLFQDEPCDPFAYLREASFTQPVATESVSYSDSVSARRWSAELSHVIGPMRGILFPGATSGACVKATVDITEASLRLQYDYQNTGGVSLAPELILLTFGHPFDGQWPRAQMPATAHATLPLGTIPFNGAEGTFDAEPTAIEVEFTVPASRFIVPIIKWTPTVASILSSYCPEITGPDGVPYNAYLSLTSEATITLSDTDIRK